MSKISVDGGKTWSEDFEGTISRELDKMGETVYCDGVAMPRASAFRDIYRAAHEGVAGLRKLENLYRDKPWTLEWKVRSADGRESKCYLREVWNGGGLKWGALPDPMYRFATKEEAEDFAKRALWDEKDPWNAKYSIVKI